jgi:hypothetical protein
MPAAAVAVPGGPRPAGGAGHRLPWGRRTRPRTAARGGAADLAPSRNRAGPGSGGGRADGSHPAERCHRDDVTGGTPTWPPNGGARSSPQNSGRSVQPGRRPRAGSARRGRPQYHGGTVSARRGPDAAGVFKRRSPGPAAVFAGRGPTRRGRPRSVGLGPRGCVRAARPRPRGPRPGSAWRGPDAVGMLAWRGRAPAAVFVGRTPAPCPCPCGAARPRGRLREPRAHPAGVRVARPSNRRRVCAVRPHPTSRVRAARTEIHVTGAAGAPQAVPVPCNRGPVQPERPPPTSAPRCRGTRPRGPLRTPAAPAPAPPRPRA